MYMVMNGWCYMRGVFYLEPVQSGCCLKVTEVLKIIVLANSLNIQAVKMIP
jgi:hypothetical protein